MRIWQKLTALFKSEQDRPDTPGAARLTEDDYEAWAAWDRLQHPEKYHVPIETASISREHSIRTGADAFNTEWEPTDKELEARGFSREEWDAYWLERWQVVQGDQAVTQVREPEEDQHG